MSWSNFKTGFLGFLFVFVFFIFPHLTLASIVIDSTSTFNCSSQSSCTWTHTAVGSPSVAVVGFTENPAGDVVTAVTWNSVAMKRISGYALQNGMNGFIYLYEITSASTTLSGTSSVAISLSSAENEWGVGVEYSGVDITSPVEGNTSSSQNNVNSITTTLTTLKQNEMLLSYVEGTSAGGSMTANNPATNVANANSGASLMANLSTSASGTNSITSNLPSSHAAFQLMLSLVPSTNGGSGSSTNVSSTLNFSFLNFVRTTEVDSYNASGVLQSYTISQTYDPFITFCVLFLSTGLAVFLTYKISCIIST